MSSKGGGAAGAVSFPAHMTTVHTDWIGTGTGADLIDVNVAEAMNAVLDPGSPGLKASCSITSIPASDIDNNEGFTLYVRTGLWYIYKFNKDGGGTTGGHYDVDITAAMTAAQVSTAVRESIVASGQFTANYYSPAVSVVIQLDEGVAGNKANADTVTDVDFVVTNFSGGVNATTINPYTSVSSYDPTSDIDDYMTDLAIYKAFVEALYPEGDLGRHAALAEALSGETNFPAIDISTVVASIVSTSLVDASSAVLSARQTALIDSASTALSVRPIAAIDASSAALRVRGAVLSDITSVALAVRAESEADLSSVALSVRTESEATGASVALSVREVGKADAEAAITHARQRAATDAATMINSANAVATSIIDSAPIAAVIAQFGQRAEVAHLKTMNRFAGGMAEINAVQGSAFLFGMALLEAEHTEKVDEFTARLSLQIYNSIIPIYLQAEMAYSAEQSRAEIESIAGHLQARTSFVLAHLETEAASIAEHMRAGTAYTGTQSEVESGFSRDHMGIESWYSKDHLQTFRERARVEIAAQAGLTAQVRSGRDTFFMQAVNDLAGMLSQQVVGKGNVASMSAEANRLKFVALGERDKQDLLYDVEEWLWQLKIFQYGSNVLSGIATGGQVLPERPSQMSTTLGGAFAGAALGTAAAPGIGTAVGAVLGGVGGYFEGEY